MRKESVMFSLMVDYESSGMNRKEFCELHHIKLSTFSYWRTRYRHAQSSTVDSGSFVSIQPTTNCSLEVVYPNGVKIVLPAGMDPSCLATLINLV